MASLVTFDGTAVKVNNQIEGDVHLFHFDKRIAAIRDNVIGEGAQITIIQQAPESKAVRKARERAEREQALLDRAHELMVLIRDPDTPVNGRFFREKEYELEAIVNRIQKDQPRWYYRTSNEGGPSRRIYDYIEKLDKDFAAQKADYIDYSEAAGYDTELARSKFKAGAVPRLLFFAWQAYLDVHGLMQGYYARDKKRCLIL